MCTHHVRISIPAVQHLPCLPSKIESCFLASVYFPSSITDYFESFQLSTVILRPVGLSLLSGRAGLALTCFGGEGLHLAVSVESRREGKVAAAPMAPCCGSGLSCLSWAYPVLCNWVLAYKSYFARSSS